MASLYSFLLGKNGMLEARQLKTFLVFFLIDHKFCFWKFEGKWSLCDWMGGRKMPIKFYVTSMPFRGEREGEQANVPSMYIHFPTLFCGMDGFWPTFWHLDRYQSRLGLRLWHETIKNARSNFCPKVREEDSRALVLGKYSMAELVEYRQERNFHKGTDKCQGILSFKFFIY